MKPPSKNKFAVAAVVVAAIAGIGVGIANAVDGNDNDDRPLTGQDLDRATEAALAETGGGRVTDAETDDGGYDVEVTLDDGTEIDVHLDADFDVVRTERDDPDDDD